MLLSSIMLKRQQPDTPPPSIEGLRLRVAEAWGTMGAAWGVPPAVARAHGYLLACRGPRTEREIREALGLSHRAATLALERTVDLGLAERVEGRRVRSRGPVGVAYRVLEDDWAWFGRVIAERKATEADPVVAAISILADDAGASSAASPDDRDLRDLATWLERFDGFLRAFDRALGVVPALEPRELEALFTVAGALPDASIQRLVRLVGALPPDDVAALADALGRLPPGAVRPAVALLGGLARATRR